MGIGADAVESRLTMPVLVKSEEDAASCAFAVGIRKMGMSLVESAWITGLGCPGCGMW